MQPAWIYLGFKRIVFMQLHIYMENETNIPNEVAHPHPGADNISSGRSAVAAQFGAVAGRHRIDGDGPPARNGRAVFALGTSPRKGLL